MILGPSRRKTVGAKASGLGRCLVLGVLCLLAPQACARSLPSNSPLDVVTTSRTPDRDNTVPFDSTPSDTSIATTGDKLSFLVRKTRGGARAKAKSTSNGKGDTETKAVAPTPPSFYWAVLHNWLYFLSLGFNAVNIPYLIREVVDGPPIAGAATTKRSMPSARSIALSGNVEAVDKILTFGGIAFLSALSDKYGRKPLIVWSSLGFALTNLLQALAGDIARAPTAPSWSSTAVLYLADFVDGCSSCMSPVCQAYVADCSLPSSLASNLGIFQGISVGGAFILAFPIGGLLGAKFGPKPAILMAAGFQLVNCLIAASLTPESNADSLRQEVRSKRIRFSEVNPITGLQKLFGIGEGGRPGVTLLRTASLTYFFLSLARGALDAQFVNYTNLRFGWTQAQSGPVLVMVGLMLAIVPRIMVPRLGLQRSINFGLVTYAIGLSSAGLVATPANFVLSIAIIAFGCVAIPALQALLANLAPPGESGALLGAVGSLTELTGAIGSSMYATLLSTFASSLVSSKGGDEAEAEAPSSFLLSILPNVPGMHFLVGASFCVIGWAISAPGLNSNREHPALKTNVDKDLLSAAAAS
mmetsp:Transcript_32613/g.76854  ORF Transcript_32613/g.76854 Transcript_32613/m.76854 type:complete len:586 (+) Transcript_32613:336-2093(+)